MLTLRSRQAPQPNTSLRCEKREKHKKREKHEKRVRNLRNDSSRLTEAIYLSIDLK